MKKYNLSTEIVTSRINQHILASTVHKSTISEIKQAIKAHRNNNCQHNIVIDQCLYMYDFRSCAICDKGLGTV